MLKRLFKYLLLLVAALVLAWLVIYLAGWSIPAGFLRASLTEELNQDLAPLRLTLEGPIRLRPTLTPTISMSRIKVVRPNPKYPVITLGSLSIKVSLTALMHGAVDLENVMVRNMRLPLAPDPGRKQQAALNFSQVSGHLLISQDRIRVEDLVLRLQRGSLTGRVLYDAEPKPPRVVIHLESPLVDLDSLAQVVALEDAQSRSTQERSKAIMDFLDTVVQRLIKSVQGELVLKADHVRWNNQTVGRGDLKITAKDSRLSIERLNIQVPGGRLFLRNTIRSMKNTLESNIELEARNFSYGFLTRKTPSSPIRSQGILSLRLSLNSQAPKVSGLLGKADGLFQVGVWPKDLETASFDLWAANLLFALLKSLAAKTGSHVNCAVGDFVMQKGLMNSRELIIDTNKVRVSGKAKVNFAERKFQVNLEPRAKKPQFFNLETPIEIKGTFDQASAGVSPGGLVGSVINFATSPVFAPLRRLFGDTLPEHGKDVCRNPQTWPPAATPPPANK
ncbi:MAG: hypothetical protein KQI62_16640 [Deltaproteobacteria bacterium]|nr:hypothetical protein [Deltaproteobacteria bacterium]